MELAPLHSNYIVHPPGVVNNTSWDDLVFFDPPTDIEYVDIYDVIKPVPIEDCRFFRSGRTDLAYKALKDLELAEHFSINSAATDQLLIWYNMMPAKYPRLSALELLEWGDCNNVANLPDLELLNHALDTEECWEESVHNLVSTYMMQFKWIQLRKDDSTGRYIEVNKDKIR